MRPAVRAHPIRGRRGGFSRAAPLNKSVIRSKNNRRIEFSTSSDDEDGEIKVVNVATKQQNGKYANPVELYSDDSYDEDIISSNARKQTELISESSSESDDNEIGNENKDKNKDASFATMKPELTQISHQCVNNLNEEEDEIVIVRKETTPTLRCSRPALPNNLERPRFRRRILPKGPEEEITTIKTNNKNQDNSIKPIQDVQNAFSFIKQTQNLPEPSEDVEFQTSLIIKNQKMFLTSMRLKMLQDDKLIFNSVDGKESNHLISENTDINAPITKENCVGYVRGRNKNNTFTLYLPTVMNERDDREAELLGISYNIEDNLPHLYLVMQKNGEPHYSVTERLMLESMARDKQKNINSFFFFESSEFEINPEKDIKSTLFRDNFRKITIVEDRTKIPVFQLSKSTTDVFIMKVRPPFKPLHGYAISVALLKMKL